MFWWRSYKSKFSSYFPDGMDRHCHLLPGVDDGAASMDEALAIIRRMKAAGFSGACCTPHIMLRFPNTPASLQERFLPLADLAARESFRLQLAAEYMVDEGFEQAITQHTPLLWDEKYLLVELPQYMLPPGWMDSLSLVTRLGYVPVLAHPERYGRLLPVEELAELTEQGILLQGNTGSICGYYGRHVQRIALELQRRGLYHCWGTDAHSEDMLRRVIAF